MKLIKAYIRHHKVEDVYCALKQARFFDMTISDYIGTGQYASYENETVKSSFPIVDSSPIRHLEILVENQEVPLVTAIIQKNGRTGYRGDGIIMVSSVDEIYHIQTSERGHLAV